MSYSKVIPISVLENYLNNPVYTEERYNKFYEEGCCSPGFYTHKKNGDDIRLEIMGLISDEYIDEEYVDYDYDEVVPISVIKRNFDKVLYRSYEPDVDDVIYDVKKLLLKKHKCDYCGQHITEKYIDCDYFYYNKKSKLTRDEQREKELEKNRSGFKDLICHHLLCSFECYNKHKNIVHFQDESTYASCANCGEEYNLLSCRCYSKDNLKVNIYRNEEYERTIYCWDCINCDHCKPETCNKNARLGGESDWDHAFRVDYKYKSNGEEYKEGESPFGGNGMWWVK